MSTRTRGITQEALGYNSKAVHRAYAKRALMKLPSLREYEQRAATKILRHGLKPS